MLLSEWKNYQRMSTSSALKMIREPSIDFHPDEIDQIFNGWQQIKKDICDKYVYC